MKFENIKYSKCPNCDKHGLPICKIGYKFNPKITCRFCGKSFKVNRILSVTILILSAILLGVICRKINDYWFDMPSWIVDVLVIVYVLIFQYFAPLEEYEEK